MTQITDLPPETLELIAKKVPRRDHKELRQVSCQLYHASYCWCLVGKQVRYSVGHRCVLKVDPCTEFTRANISNIWVAKEVLKRKNANWDTGLQLASENGHIKVVELLIADSRVDPTADNNWAIQAASGRGHIDVLKLLLRDTRIDPAVDEPVGWASRNGHTGVVELLLNDIRVDTTTCTWPIHTASMCGHTDIVKLWLKHVDPSINDNCAIRVASEHGHIDIVKLLLKEARVDPTACDNDAIREASKNGHIDVVELLLKHVDPSPHGNSIIRLATMNGHIDVLELLLKDTRIGLAAVDDSVIQLATRCGRTKIANMLRSQRGARCDF